MSYALQTDRYELTMLDSFVKDGTVNKQAVFEVFARKLQPGFRYGVFAGLERVLHAVQYFFFDGISDYLREEGIVSVETARWLRDFRFSGTIEAYREGDLYFPNSPVLTVSGTLGECVILETVILSILNHDSSIATKAARMVSVAEGRPIIEMGSRRTHEDAAVAAARAAYIAGFASTSNLRAGLDYGVPTVGTAAHAFTLAHESEEQAFASQIAAQGAGTTLLVDTYDTEQGVHNAVMAARAAGADGPGAVRLDSGDLAYEATMARARLDNLGAHDTRVVVTSDLDEYVMKDLASAPIDGYGVGTKLVSTPPSGFVYKLVAIETEDGNMRPVAKKAKDKVSVGGRKTAHRILENGKVVREVYFTDKNTQASSSDPSVTFRYLQDVVMEKGEVVVNFNIEDTRAFHARCIAELPESERKVWSGEFGPFLTAEDAS